MYHTTLVLLINSFIYNDTTTTDIYTLSLHDALPIYTNHANKARNDQVAYMHEYLYNATQIKRNIKTQVYVKIQRYKIALYSREKLLSNIVGASENVQTTYNIHR